MRAVFVENHKVAKYLKRKGAQVNCKNSEGDTILQIALRHKMKKVIAFWLFIGWDRNLKNNNGEDFYTFL